MLLDLAGLDKQDRIMVQASINNERDFDKAMDALILQDPRIHIKESRRTASQQGKNRSSKSRGQAKAMDANVLVTAMS